MLTLYDTRGTQEGRRTEFLFCNFATQLIRNVLIVNAMLAMMKGISKERNKNEITPISALTLN